jgi:hypothetical protein
VLSGYDYQSGGPLAAEQTSNKVRMNNVASRKELIMASSSETTIGCTRDEKEYLRVIADITIKLSNGSLTLEQAKRFAKKQNPFDVTITEKDEILVVTVNRDRTIADGVVAGKYDWKNNDINDVNFRRTGSGSESAEIILVHFDRSMSTSNVLKELEKRNLRPADLQELLAIGEQSPDKQRAFPIVALGSVWLHPLGLRCVPYLRWYGSERALNLIWLERDWDDRCCFAALRK